MALIKNNSKYFIAKVKGRKAMRKNLLIITAAGAVSAWLRQHLPQDGRGMRPAGGMERMRTIRSDMQTAGSGLTEAMRV